MPATEVHLSLRDAARRIGVSRPLLDRILDDGRLPYLENAQGDRKIELVAIHSYINERDEIAAQLAAARAGRRPLGHVIAEELGLDLKSAKRLGIIQDPDPHAFPPDSSLSASL